MDLQLKLMILIRKHCNSLPTGIMRQNSFIVFLDRDISELPVSGRPLSQRDGVKALAAQRLPLYRKWSDYIIPVKDIEQTAADIEKALEV